jgi:3-oxoacyl-[acyl-carrier protein] reductase
MDLRLKNKVALVAGGSMGLGLAVAKMLAAEGARIAIGALDDFNLKEAEKEIRSETGGDVVVIPTDLTDSGQAKWFVARACAHFGTVDILVNNAGGPPSLPFLDIDDDQWDFGFRLNLMSTIAMSREAIR